MSAVASMNHRFPASPRPGPAGRRTRPLLPARPDRTSGGLSQSALETMAEGLASVVTAEHVPLEPGAPRSYARILATEDYEVWLIAWAAAGMLELHDHGGSSGAVCVVEGELVETFTDLVDRHPLRSVTMAVGSPLPLSAMRVHEVWNPGPRPALSVHVYSPPLRTMTFFDHRAESFLKPLRTEHGELAG
ncbi:MAG: hypothetical protein QOK39_592 [Acidimicrobiaceae bacterium]|nr:hypothetical protein [Acidimicrobiaceae bacterium]